MRDLWAESSTEASSDVANGLGVLPPRTAAARELLFFLMASFPSTFYGGSFGIALNSTTQKHARLGFVAGSRGPANIYIRGL